jgi:hypothetical protein
MNLALRFNRQVAVNEVDYYAEKDDAYAYEDFDAGELTIDTSPKMIYRDSEVRELVKQSLSRSAGSEKRPEGRQERRGSRVAKEPVMSASPKEVSSGSGQQGLRAHSANVLSQISAAYGVSSTLSKARFSTSSKARKNPLDSPYLSRSSSANAARVLTKELLPKRKPTAAYQNSSMPPTMMPVEAARSEKVAVPKQKLNSSAATLLATQRNKHTASHGTFRAFSVENSDSQPPSPAKTATVEATRCDPPRTRGRDLGYTGGGDTTSFLESSRSSDVDESSRPGSSARRSCLSRKQSAGTALHMSASLSALGGSPTDQSHSRPKSRKLYLGVDQDGEEDEEDSSSRVSPLIRRSASTSDAAAGNGQPRPPSRQRLAAQHLFGYEITTIGPQQPRARSANAISSSLKLATANDGRDVVTALTAAQDNDPISDGFDELELLPDQLQSPFRTIVTNYEISGSRSDLKRRKSLRDGSPRAHSEGSNPPVHADMSPSTRSTRRKSGRSHLHEPPAAAALFLHLNSFGATQFSSDSEHEVCQFRVVVELINLGCRVDEAATWSSHHRLRWAA